MRPQRRCGKREKRGRLRRPFRKASEELDELELIVQIGLEPEFDAPEVFDLRKCMVAACEICADIAHAEGIFDVTRANIRECLVIDAAGHRTFHEHVAPDQDFRVGKMRRERIGGMVAVRKQNARHKKLAAPAVRRDTLLR